MEGGAPSRPRRRRRPAEGACAKQCESVAAGRSRRRLVARAFRLAVHHSMEPPRPFVRSYPGLDLPGSATDCGPVWSSKPVPPRMSPEVSDRSPGSMLVRRTPCSNASRCIRRASTRRAWASTRRASRSGPEGLVLLPSIDRLVALLAVYTRERSLEDLMPSLAMHVVKSKLGTREITLEFAAESSDRMDRIAETARLVGGFTFTGTARHFVQYRDAGAPFGYDATELLPTDAALALYHDRFSQTYDVERAHRAAGAAAAPDAPRRSLDEARAGRCASSWPSRGSGRRSCTTSCGRASTARSASPSGRRRARSTTRPCVAGSSASPSCPSACARCVHAHAGHHGVRARGAGRRRGGRVPPPGGAARVPRLRPGRARARARARRRAVDARRGFRRWARSGVRARRDAHDAASRRPRRARRGSREVVRVPLRVTPSTSPVEERDGDVDRAGADPAAAPPRLRAAARDHRAGARGHDRRAARSCGRARASRPSRSGRSSSRSTRTSTCPRATR